MYKKIIEISAVLLFLISTFSISNVFALDWFQNTKINNDRSGTIRIFYWTNSSDVKGNDSFKGLPFTEEKIRAAFGSDNNKIQTLKVKTNNSDTASVNLVIAFKDIQKINTAPGFAYSKIVWYKNADSTVFMAQMEKETDYLSTDKIIYTFVLPTTEIVKTTGTKTNENTVTYGLNTNNLANGANFVITFKNSNDVNTSSNDGNKSNDGNEKSCGLFGIELPFVLFSGLSYVLINRKKKKN